MMHGKRLSMDPNTPVNQSVVVSGESGAGKTEASKHVMNFLIAADKEIQRPASSSATASNEEDKLGDAIREVLVKSNIIFESFGNAKTLRNDNSSRFGKYIKLQYSDDSKILSAFTETFLLEKSRLMSVGTNERTYHIFYQLFHQDSQQVSSSSSSSTRHQQLRKQLHLCCGAGSFRMLQDNEGKVLRSGQDELLEELESSLQAIGCTMEELTSLWTVLASLLHLGNLTCYNNEDKPPAEVETPAIDGHMHHIDGNVCIHSPTIPLSSLADLLGVTPEMFASRLTTQRVKVSTRRSVTIKRLNTVDINNNVAALIKWMYSCLFSWLVSKVNYAHCSVGGDSPSMASRRAVKFIGILDIFGFEILQSNSFEQLCINYTNERLQQQFNAFVFDREQDIYRAEGLDWQSISYRDNQHVIDLIGKKPLGLLCILEEQGMLNRGSSDEGALYSAFNSTHDKKHVAYERSRFNDNRFTVHHFAGDVTYTIAGRGGCSIYMHVCVFLTLPF
ncbi:hypothetical protein EON64_13000 [archaeon]|nr:MAG: hypothetical protein EON64_13000 [archaeon]